LSIEEKIINLLRKHPLGLTTKEIAEKLGISRTTIAKYVEKLKGKGIIAEKRVGAYRLWLLGEYYQAKKLTARRILVALTRALLRILGENSYQLAFMVGKAIAQELYETVELNSSKPFESIASMISDITEGVSTQAFELGNNRGVIIIKMSDTSFPIEFIKLLANILQGAIEELIKKSCNQSCTVNVNISKKENAYEIVMEINLTPQD